MAVRSRGVICARVMQKTSAPRDNRGHRECRAPMHPQPRVRIERSTRVSPPQVRTAKHRHSLREWFYGFLRARPGDRACCLRREPSCASIAAHLISASGYQAHTTSPSASASHALREGKRPSLPAPRSWRSRAAPLGGTGWRGLLKVICPTTQGKFWRKRRRQEVTLPQPSTLSRFLEPPPSSRFLLSA